MFEIIKKKIFHLEKKKVVMINVTAVHTQRWITISTYPINSKYLKYITPINPHQKDPNEVNRSPLLNWWFILLKYSIIRVLLDYFIVELNNYNYKT